MLNQHFLKPKLTVNTIGKTKFWLGIAAGMLFSVSLTLLYANFYEIFRAIGTGIYKNIIPYPEEEKIFYKYAISYITATLGFCITCFIWFKGYRDKHKYRKGRVHLLRNAPLFTLGVLLITVGRYASIMSVAVASLLIDLKVGLWKEFRLFEGYQFDLLFCLLHIVFYLQMWMYIKLVFKNTLKWFLVTTVVVIFFGLVLAQFAVVGTDIVDKAHYKRFKYMYEYVDNELAISSQKYNITFEEWERVALIENRTELSDSLIKTNLAIFYGERVSDSQVLTPVTIKDIVIQKMITKLTKPNNLWNTPSFVTPKVIYKHLVSFNYDSTRVQELFNVLNEQGHVYNLYFKLDRDYRYHERIDYLKEHNEITQLFRMYYPYNEVLVLQAFEYKEVYKKLEGNDEFKEYFLTLDKYDMRYWY